MEKVNKISKLAAAFFAAGIILLILMIFSCVGAFSAIAADTESEGNLFYGLPNQTSTLNIYNTNTNTARITPELVNKAASSEEGISTTMKFNVFKDAYLSEDGNVVIQSGDEWKIVAPGASNLDENTSTFTISNESGQTVDVDFQFTCEFNDDAIPLHFKVIDPQNNYLLGSEDSFEDPLKINNIKQSRSIASGEAQTYQFPWYWPFYKSDDDDVYDTKLGNKAVEKPITVTLNVKAEEPTPVPPGPEPTPVPDPKANIQTGDIIKIGLLGVIGILAIISACVMIKRGRKNE